METLFIFMTTLALSQTYDYSCKVSSGPEYNEEGRCTSMRSDLDKLEIIFEIFDSCADVKYNRDLSSALFIKRYSSKCNITTAAILAFQKSYSFLIVNGACNNKNDTIQWKKNRLVIINVCYQINSNYRNLRLQLESGSPSENNGHRWIQRMVIIILILIILAPAWFWMRSENGQERNQSVQDNLNMGRTARSSILSNNEPNGRTSPDAADSVPVTDAPSTSLTPESQNRCCQNCTPPIAHYFRIRAELMKMLSQPLPIRPPMPSNSERADEYMEMKSFVTGKISTEDAHESLREEIKIKNEKAAAGRLETIHESEEEE